MTYEGFKKRYLELIALEYDTKEIEVGKRFIIYNTPLGNVTYYPEADRLQIHEGNKWLSNGFDVMINKLNIKELEQ